MRIFLIGFMGSGKTHWARQLAAQMKIPFYDLDEVISGREGKTVSEIFAQSGEEAFRVKEREVLESLIDENASMVLSCGGGTPCFFNNIERMKKYGVVVWLNTHVEILLSRLMKEKATRPLIKNISDDDMRSYIVRKLNERRMYYEQADVIIDNENSISANEFIQTILHA
ncbi:MAG: shikimate kinase [Chitinophagaceae bacterium]|nr:shikimate kinase [Chitinophagaceae bacterium]